MAVAAEVFGQPSPVACPWWYRFRLATPDPGLVKMDLAGVHCSGAISLFRTADTIVVPGWPERMADTAPLIRELQRAARRGARIVSYCTGSFLLAEAGLLDGLVATTHWGAIERFGVRFPDVQVDPNVLYVDNGTILTAAGSAAAIDVSLHIVRKDLGAQVATAVAREMVTAPHRSGGQAQFVPAELPRAKHGTTLGELLVWMLARLDQDLPLQRIARQANTSSRTLSRQFVTQVGVTPHQWLIEQRVLKAQTLLEQGEPVEVVAQRVGFRTGTVLRSHFSRLTSTSPSDYQRTFTRLSAGH